MGTHTMSLNAGDVYYASLDPTRGTEQKGTRPVVIVSVVSIGPRAIAVPLTTAVRQWPTRIGVVLHGIKVEAMCEQVRTIDLAHLSDELYARIEPATLAKIQQTIARLIGVYS